MAARGPKQPRLDAIGDTSLPVFKLLIEIGPEECDIGATRVGKGDAGSVQRDINILRHLWSVAINEWRWAPLQAWNGLRMTATAARPATGLARIRPDRDAAAMGGPTAADRSRRASRGGAAGSLRTAMRAGEVMGLTRRP